ncbi:hypothetical protein [Streptomyces sp. TR06-5]|uniref:hypothetical protein n=1 Tax=Streptomyces sp. TR06-5 TaxID=3385976 RepID=UPI0039A05FCB
MGFIDALDNVLTDIKGRHEATAEARKFERSVKPGRTYYSVETCALPWGDQDLLKEWQFNDTCLGSPSIGAHTAAQIWLTNGPLYDHPVRGLQTIQEYIDAGSDEELVRNGKPLKRKDRAKALENARLSIARR